ncbi:MAG: Two component regulator propeller, partial [Verrucomicrobiota bacterium]
MGKNGLSDNFINSVLPDLQGNVWALTYNNGIYITVDAGASWRKPADAGKANGGN